MAISVQIGTCGDDNRVVQKTVTFTELTGNIVFRDIAELHSPEFTVGSTLSAEFNYCCISGVDEKTRYYYAEVINERTGYSRVICRLDVLMTYFTDIQNVDVIPVRGGSLDARNSYIADSAQPYMVAKYNEIMNPVGYDSALPDACLNYGNMSLVAAIIGTDDDIGVTVKTNGGR